MKSQGDACTQARRKSKRLGLLAAMFAISICALGMNASVAFALSPAVETLPASSVAEKGATLNGKVNPNGAETKAYFEYGTTTSYGSKTAEVNVGSGTTTLARSEAVSGLSPNTVYHYRIVASNSFGSSQGADQTFTTVGPPTAAFPSATPESSGEEATLKAIVDPNGQSTTYQFEYGTQPGTFTDVAPIPAASAGSGYGPVTVDYKVTGLTPGTVYYFRVSATNAGGKATSGQSFFASSNHPGIQMAPVSEISRTGATLNATIEPHGSSTSYHFEYGTTASYGFKTPSKSIGAEVGSSAVAEPIAGLKPNTVYHYRLVTSNSTGSHISGDLTFTTLSNATLYLKGGVKPLELNTNLRAFSSNLTFSGESGVHSCNETEFSGKVTENPGATQGLNTSKMQNSGGKCPWKAGYSIHYLFITANIPIEYAKNGAGEGFARTSKFSFFQAIYFEGLKVAECEYRLTLAGTFKTATALEPTLAGKTEVLKGNANCPGSESVSGKFVVTSSGMAVEAK
jgi:hypothetical protein